MKNVLIIEDEKSIARFLQLELSHEGYNCDIAYDGEEGLSKILSNTADIVILDIMLPKMNGMQVCEEARKKGVDIPIIMLTARDDVSDKVGGFDVGADDYMTKPFAIEELIARMKVALKKSSKANESSGDENILRAGKLTLDLNRFEASYGSDVLNMTKKEMELLEYLMRNKNIALSREKIVEHIWGYDYEGETNVTDVYIRYLRSKIDNVYNTSYFRTVRGIGYMFEYKE